MDCPQCSSFTPCDGNDVSPCPDDTYTSCIFSYANWPSVLPPTSFYDMACSTIDCSLLPTPVEVYIRIADEETAWLSSQCWNGGPCNSTIPPPTPDYPPVGTGDAQCPACMVVNDTPCGERFVRCNPDERCIDGLADVMLGTGDLVRFRLRVRGCSNIPDDLCGFLSTPNIRIGNIVFRQLICSDPDPITKNLNSGAALAGAP